MPVTTGSPMNPRIPMPHEMSEIVCGERRHGQRADEEERHHRGGAHEPLELQPLVAARAAEAHHERRDPHRHDERARDVEGVVDVFRQDSERVVEVPRLLAEIAVDEHLRYGRAGERDAREPDDRAPARSRRTARGEQQRQEQHDPEQRDLSEPGREPGGHLVAGERRLTVLEAVIGVQRGRNLHGPDQPEPEQDPANGVARLPARDEGPDDRERERGREEDVRRPDRIRDRRRRRRSERRGEDAQRQPGARQRGERPDGADSPATRHGA